MFDDKLFNGLDLCFPFLSGYMEGLCTILYDILRPYIIRIDHLETLAEICSILKVEMLDEHVTYSRKQRTATQRTQDGFY